MCKNCRKWSSLVELGVMLSQGKANLVELVAKSTTFGVVDDRNKKRGRIPSISSATNPTVSLNWNWGFTKRRSGCDRKRSWNWGFKVSEGKADFEILVGKSSLGVVDDDDKKRGRIPSISASKFKKRKRNWGLKIPLTAGCDEDEIRPSEEMKKRIVDCGGDGESVVLVIQKKLFPSDVDSDKARLSIPHKQVTEATKLFFTKEELKQLNDNPKGLPVTVFGEAAATRRRMWLRNWSSNKQYTLVKNWNHFCQTNGYETNTTLQVWAFRKNDGTLCLAIADYR